MTYRKPLVVVAGRKQELPTGDSMDGPVDGVTLAAQTTGFTAAGGTTSKTLIVNETISVLDMMSIARQWG